MEKNYTKGIFYLFCFVASIVALAVLKVTATFILPLTISILFSFIFYPFVKKLSKFRIPWILSVLIVIGVTGVLFSIVANILITSCKSIVAAYPRYEARFTTVYSMIAETFNLPFDENSSLFANMWNSLGVRTFVQNSAISLSNFLLSGAKVIFLVSLMILFFMMEMREMKGKIKNAFPEEKLNRKIIYITIKTISDVTRFISIKFYISLLTGTLVGIVCFSVGLDFPIVWGFLAFVLNFIPNFGSAISFVMTTGFSIIQFYPVGYKIAIIGLSILLINSILGSILEPKWEGNDLGISPFLILVSLTLWGYIWGFAGMILSVPILVITKIICENIEELKPVAALIGSKKKSKAAKK
ncbi:AI-2E family transporter [Treponema sp.]|uniref:AI-2E family transporter n=1 Tax=Treponema sp. TaxID=166 RepID=UPI00298EA4C7|nr:AI-2E family transporter [Treponema sp.]MCQ2241868.1 AI-2E family transporter [Treponema sp.]